MIPARPRTRCRVPRSRPLAAALISSLFFFALAPCPAVAAPNGMPAAVPPGEAARIGKRIWRNECGGRVDGLLAWNAGEAFPSLGIGHFIWYPQGDAGPFRESFPALLDHLAASGIALPRWLSRARHAGCPWPDRASFRADLAGKGPGARRLGQLRDLLAGTIDLQAEFLVARLRAALPELLDAAPDERARERIGRRFRRIAAAPGGLYPLVDYVNFKGEGTAPTERHRGEGWGLLQALDAMTDGPDPCADFAAACERVLERRVANAPRDESRWLAGWRTRVRTYAAIRGTGK